MLGTLDARLAEHVDRRPEHAALIDGDRVVSWGALDEDANRLAGHLAAEAGVGRGDVVGLLVSNRLEFATGFFACQKLGAISSCLNFRTSPEAVAATAAAEGHGALIHDEAFRPAADRVGDAAPGCRCISVDGGDAAPSLRELLAARPDSTPLHSRADSSDVCNVIHTSGTTGAPKGAALTHETQMLSGIQYSLEMGLDRTHVGMSLAPVVIGAATNFFVSFIVTVGAPQVMLGEYESLRALTLLERHGVTEAFAVPTQIYQMAAAVREQPELRPSALRLIRTGGSAMPRDLVETVRADLGCEILNTYGTTEACTAITTMHTGQDPPEAWGSIGKPTYFQEVRVISTEGVAPGPDDVVEPPGRGQLVNRGPQCAPVEFGSGEGVTDDGGWQRTRDVVEIDAAGYLWPLDRLDNVIISGGENIYPQEVELFLATHPQVEDVAVVGLPDEEWGQRVAALVVPSHPGLSAAEVERFCLDEPDWPRHKRPRVVRFVDALPRNILGKLDRGALPELLTESASTQSPPAGGST